jgi:hypothetical protein
MKLNQIINQKMKIYRVYLQHQIPIKIIKQMKKIQLIFIGLKVN